ncbi:unnamed protein product [Parascedosporium putredinis]|uniref:Heterokaryon incompatibility domain-containing protein n=1 Tax=Parascedosporium putredinis TaxID=1442378 RepID=A0A9P1H1F0_9PEZI|nr:unnamed protein product [Parascedosporium putredinis]CAI7993682.1 unnamed protein product [Parascedosporium putredinis]
MFRYQPLDADQEEIRIVRFVRPFDPGAPLALELRHTALKGPRDPEPYSALSYVWGSDRHTREILINGEPIAITFNLHDVLVQLRENGVTGWLWADSVCIQQAHTAEKETQVGFMGQIFQRAGLVYMWLGRSTDEMYLAMSFLDSFSPNTPLRS